MRLTLREGPPFIRGFFVAVPHNVSLIEVKVFLLLLCALFIVGASFWLGVSGPFLLDDFHNLEMMALYGGVQDGQGVLRYVFGMDGLQFDRCIARLSFLMNDQFWPSIPSLYKSTNIGLHLISSLLIFLVVNKLTIKLNLKGNDRYWLSLFTSILWLVFPMHVSTVLYVVQRMTQLMFIFFLASVYAYLSARSSKSIFRLLGWLFLAGFFAVLSVLSKENGASLLLIFPLVELFFYIADSGGNPKYSRLFNLIGWVSALCFVVLFLFSVISVWPRFDGRTFSAGERLLSQGMVLNEYLLGLISGFGDYTIFHDDVEFTLSETSSLAQLFSWGCTVCVIVLSVVFSRRLPVFFFGVAWFYIGHIIESTIIPLELMFEHRNYLPSFGVALLLADALVRLKNLMEVKGLKSISFLPTMTLFLLYLISNVQNAALWGDNKMIVSKWAADRPKSLRSQLEFVSMLESNQLLLMALHKLEDIQPIFNDPSVGLRIMLLQCELGEPVTEIDPDTFRKVPFNSGMLYMLKAVTADDNYGCKDSSIKGGRAALVEAVAEMPLLTAKKNYLAQYYDVAGDFYIRVGNYQYALKSRENAYLLQPSVPTTLKLAELYLLGGDNDRAREMIVIARNLDARRWFSDSRVRRDIDRLENIVRQM